MSIKSMREEVKGLKKKVAGCQEDLSGVTSRLHDQNTNLEVWRSIRCTMSLKDVCSLVIERIRNSMSSKNVNVSLWFTGKLINVFLVVCLRM